MKKRIVCLTLAILMCGSQVVSVMADRESDLREEQAWTSQQLDATYARMSALWDQKQQLESQIESLNSDLVNVMVSIQTLESDIASKEAEIEKTQGDLTKAQNAKDKQYGAMKKRIQYLYEKGGNNAWFQMMLNADNLADLLTRAEYTQQMYEQDRESLQKYARTIEEVQKLEDQYEQEKADFETMKEEYEAQQSNLQYQLDVTRANSADCENEIAYAQQQATEYANLLEQQQANRQPGQRADRAQQSNQRIKHAGEEQRTADQKPQRNARQRRQAEAHRHALQGGQHVPADAHVIGPVLIERIGKQGQRRVQRAQRRGKAFAMHRRQLPGQQQHSQPQQRGQQALGELTQPARDGRRGAPDLHRRQDNHFARRVVHADDRLLTLCLLHLMPPYVE